MFWTKKTLIGQNVGFFRIVLLEKNKKNGWLFKLNTFDQFQEYMEPKMINNYILKAVKWEKMKQCKEYETLKY